MICLSFSDPCLTYFSALAFWSNFQDRRRHTTQQTAGHENPCREVARSSSRCRFGWTIYCGWRGPLAEREIVTVWIQDYGRLSCFSIHSPGLFQDLICGWSSRSYIEISLSTNELLLRFCVRCFSNLRASWMVDRHTTGVFVFLEQF